MTKDNLREDYVTIQDHYFPVSITLHKFHEPGMIFTSHWHEHFQFIYCTKGEAQIYCSCNPINLSAQEAIFINANEMHYGESINGDISYYVVMVHQSFVLSNGIDSCQTKYISPLLLNQILFANKISNDAELTNYIKMIIQEYNEQKTGYELAVKAYLYQAIVLMLRNHAVRSFTPRELDLQMENMKRFQSVFTYIEDEYSKHIDINELARIGNVSTGHFCRIFKKLTGKSAIDYINQLRVEKAAMLLKQGQSINETAFATGFNNTNYFSRVFKKYKNVAPKEFRKLIKV
ncbi:MAG: AraC family transcriptional regulator [Desulfitobacteriaceae bacterium]|nr:AraC family transcriptional regulator [Desulfitobacteriaceae bacterium]